jgi:hypothetical protein
MNRIKEWFLNFIGTTVVATLVTIFTFIAAFSAVLLWVINLPRIIYKFFR